MVAVRAMATMSGRGVMTSRTRVWAKRATAATRRPSSGSSTGAAVTSGLTSWGGTVRGSLAPRRRSAATSG